jgi:hypothetical protein
LSEVCPFRSTRRARLKIGLARRSLIGSARLRKSQARYFAISVAERRARPAAAFHLRSQWRLRIRIPIPMSNSWRAEVAIEEFHLGTRTLVFSLEVAKFRNLYKVQSDTFAVFGVIETITEFPLA